MSHERASAGGCASIAGAQSTTAATSPSAIISAGETVAARRSPERASERRSARSASGSPAAPKLDTTATRLPTCESTERPSRKKSVIPTRTPPQAMASNQVTRSRSSGHERSAT